MVPFQILDILRFLTINSVTTGMRELNGTSYSKFKARNHEVSSGLDRVSNNGGGKPQIIIEP